MDAWQKSHIALVVPLTNAIYFDGGDTYSTAKNKDAVRMMSVALRDNFKALKAKGIPITPSKMNVFRLCPLLIMRMLLKLFCKTKLAEAVSSHVPYIKDEMLLLEKAFDELINE
jgi:2-dehydropantoate 2-reductase